MYILRFLTLEFSRSLTQFYGNSKVKALFYPEFPRLKVTNLKIPGFIHQKCMSSSLSIWIFLNSPIINTHVIKLWRSFLVFMA